MQNPIRKRTTPARRADKAPGDGSERDDGEQPSGCHLGDFKSSQRTLSLISSINQILSQSLHRQSPDNEPNPASTTLALLLKNSLNLLAKEIHLPFLLLSIQNDYDNEAIIAESSIANPCSAAQRNVEGEGLETRNVNYRHRYRPGEGIIGMVTKNNRPYFCPDIHSAPEFLNRTGLKEQFSNTTVGFLCLPITQNPTENSPNEQVIGTLSTGLCYLRPPARDRPSLLAEQGDLENYLLDSPMFTDIGELGAFLKLVCDLMVNTVKTRIELEQEHRRLQRANAILRKRSDQNESLRQIVGRSGAMQELFMQITQVAKVDTTVLIRGESGTGKELVARAIHQSSIRAKKPFISVNCATLPEGVIDSELFGHVKGSFTGALHNHKGRFELAEGGTLFLDEISELPLHLQSKLLRILQEKEYQPLGSESMRSADVRIIAASNHNLEQDIQERNFREDLFFRLSVFPIHLPLLRERKSDITLLVDHFLEKNAVRIGTNVVRVADSTISLLMSYNWPGNVRELENVIERASILCEDGVIYAHHLPPTLQSGKSSQTTINYTLKEALERLELDMLYEALKDNQGNMRLAAKQLDISERQIGLRMNRYNLEYKDFRQ
ncbi:sigma-54-dependent Fis family transcriptional regulator [Candidatus Haliotispira prima]|uniref:Sigma-54-dependent Fis family transcriptional regulator n=1 Tax=Candidatus Haliotispira prima TaxID=3034016 RepID=A0ABY8MIC4_9SPIO|nr:sigma-54-dependent Fis family transcriptional regulator [Candidatus Haliotispira prima]